MVTRRDLLKSAPASAAAFAIGGNLMLESPLAHAASAAQPAADHFHPKGKAPSKYTKAILKAAREGLPFGDTRDFDEQKRGLIAPMTEM